MIHLESDRMRVELDPAFGARVTALWDKRLGREWLVTGPREGGDTYGAAQARGWDECFPTVAPCDHPAWGPLRDHGLLWGRPWSVRADGSTAETTCEDDRFAFTRTLELHGPRLEARYVLEARADIDWMWSQHGLLAAQPGERIRLDGFDRFTAWGEPFDWPHREGRDLSLVEGPDAAFALKAYARCEGPARAEVLGEEGGLALSWDGADLPALGLWMSWGGWPADPALGAPVHQLALEPTTSPADDLASAGPTARRLPAGGRAAWRVDLTLTDPA
jgi:hypothetical protein